MKTILRKKVKRKSIKVAKVEKTVKKPTHKPDESQPDKMVPVNFTLSESDFRAVKMMTLDLRIGYRDIMLAGLKHLNLEKGK